MCLMQQHGVLRAPQTLLFGAGSRSAITREISKLGSRVGIIVDPFLAGSPEFAELLTRLDDAEISHHVFQDVVPELPLDSIDTAARQIDAFEPEVVLGYGGGSALDLAKLVALKLSHPGEISQFYGENQVPGAVLPIIAVPTTAGTGSEVTPVAVVSDPSHSLKVGVSDPSLIPTVAVVDPELTFGAPPSVTAFSGIDALAHAIESYTAAEQAPGWSGQLPVSIGANRLSGAFSLEAVTALGTHLVRAFENGQDREARVGNAYGATMAGIAFGNAGVHFGHAIQYPLGALTKTPHGMGTGMLLPYVMRASIEVRTERLADIATAFGLEASGSVEARAEAAIRRVSEICRDLQLPRSLTEMGVTVDQLDEIANKSVGITRLVKNAPFEASLEHALAIVTSAYEGREAR